MEVKKRQQVLLGVLAVVLALAVYRGWPGATGSSSSLGGRRPGVGGAANGSETAAIVAPDVRLEALAGARPTPGDNERNLFKFKPRYVPPPAPAPSSGFDAPANVPAGVPPTAPLAPIPLKFIGVLEGTTTRRIAILTDGRGAPMYGKEGETVLGQYRILHIGTESIEMEYLDGRGRQTIRLSGS